MDKRTLNKNNIDKQEILINDLSSIEWYDLYNSLIMSNYAMIYL